MQIVKRRLVRFAAETRAKASHSAAHHARYSVHHFVDRRHGWSRSCPSPKRHSLFLPSLRIHLVGVVVILAYRLHLYHAIFFFTRYSAGGRSRRWKRLVQTPTVIDAWPAGSSACVFLSPGSLRVSPHAQLLSRYATVGILQLQYDEPVSWEWIENRPETVLNNLNHETRGTLGVTSSQKAYTHARARATTHDILTW